MNFCPNAFNQDMTDPRNLDYCHEIQRHDGERCRKKRCPYLVADSKDKVAERPEKVQRGLF